MLGLILSIVLAAWLTPPQAIDTAPVYAALLNVRYHGTPASGMSILDVTVAMPTLHGASPDLLKEFDDVPAALRRAANEPASTKSGPLSRRLFPPGTKFLSKRAVDRTFTGPGEEQWETFRRTHNTTGWLSLSDVLVTADQLDALVYYEAHCGGLCGEGGYIWLHRNTPQSRWSIAKRIVRWMA